MFVVQEPLNSEDDVSDEEDQELFDTENVVVCQYDKVRDYSWMHCKWICCCFKLFIFKSLGMFHICWGDDSNQNVSNT